jgi:hypothetical protein
MKALEGDFQVVGREFLKDSILWKYFPIFDLLREP